ncbi:FkbM family methyltransferase [Mucilaginibacter sp. AW1-7]|uniref:FkbM family methyltransferase n=1 Tax=Mucilaginibacter sp. AW1-7 TaxID=3349874 RepID=UPI003F73FDF5
MKRVLNALRSRLRLLAAKRPDTFQRTYAQCGEDRILLTIFQALGIEKPSYIDVGANHPANLNNTYLFYLQGSTGINVEADPDLLEAFNRQRPRDVNINVGVGLEASDTLDFFVMSNRVLNTFSREEADRIAAYGTYTVQSVRKIKVVPLQTIVDTYFAMGNGPDFISIDVEGLDYEILKTLDLSKYTRTVFCVETLSYTEDNSAAKNEAIAAYFAANGFFVYADTYINTIFISSMYWHSRGKSQAMQEQDKSSAS